MSESEIIKKSANIQLRCINYINSVEHYNVLVYMPFRSEVRTNILREELLSNKKEVYYFILFIVLQFKEMSTLTYIFI